TIEAREQLELLQFVSSPSKRAVQIRELLPRGNQARRERHDSLKRRLGPCGLPTFTKAQRLQIVRIGHPIGHAKRDVQRLQGAVEIPIAIVGKRQLVAYARGMVVQAEALPVNLGRIVESLLFVSDVAELVEWTYRA